MRPKILNVEINRKKLGAIAISNLSQLANGLLIPSHPEVVLTLSRDNIRDMLHPKFRINA